jgi:putative transcriptional regulator
VLEIGQFADDAPGFGVCSGGGGIIGQSFPLRRGCRNGDRSCVFQAAGRSLSIHHKVIIRCIRTYVNRSMGYVRLRIRELADAKGWTLKEVADRSEVNYNTLKSYVQRDTLNTVDLAAVYKIARALDVSIEDLMEVVE